MIRKKEIEQAQHEKWNTARERERERKTGADRMIQLEQDSSKAIHFPFSNRNPGTRCFPFSPCPEENDDDHHV